VPLSAAISTKRATPASAKINATLGREAEGAAGCVACSLQPAAGMRLIRSLPSTPSASTRDPFQYFNSLLRLISFSGETVSLGFPRFFGQ
jgi:hypothetical protein